MKLSRTLIVSFILFVLAMSYNTYRILTNTIEPFDDSVNALLASLTKASQNDKGNGSYTSWIGWLYAHPESSAIPLNEFKSRVFQPSCKFRLNWSTDIPTGLTIPQSPETIEIANTAYSYFLKGLSNGNQVCINALDDARRRFMEPECAFLNPSDPKSYSKGYTQVFK